MRGQLLLIVVLLSSVGLAACDSGNAAMTRTAQVLVAESAAADERLVFRVSADGTRLDAFDARNAKVPLGRVALPKGAVWSVVGAGDDLKVWVHGDERVTLVSARDWKVIGDWARPAGGPAQRMLAQRDVGVR